MQTVHKNAEQLNKATRGIFTDTPPVLNGLYEQSKASGKICCGWLYTNVLPASLQSQVSESVVIAIAIPDAIQVDWVSQTENWLIPHNEIDYVQQHSTRLMMLGNGPVAIEMDLAWHAFFGTEGSVFVLYVCAAGTLIVRYSWNERLLVTLDALYKSAGPNYTHDEEEAERSIAFDKPIHGCSAGAATLPSGYFAIAHDGNLTDYQPSRRSRDSEIRPD
ncbi:hypothetical protein P0D75_06915 [Paraburkholderia sediminicola]|uniref:hypothetical protein n=1 Tax=Paraburkholderia sediminicola TaxID=458836 RepID=UPI0038BBEE80